MMANSDKRYILSLAIALAALPASSILGQDGDRDDGPAQRGFPGLGFPGLPGPPGGRFGGPPGGPPGGPGGMMGQEQPLVEQFDKDGDKRLDRDERTAAREFMKSRRQVPGMRGGMFGGPGRTAGGPGGERRERGGPGGPGGFMPPGPPGPRGMFGRSEPTKPGAKFSPADVESYPDEPLYTDKVIRTLFIDFEDSDWEQVMQDFYRTDVDVPATLTVDGVVYPQVGVHFRGLSSFAMVGEGQKRSLNLAMDYAKPDQRLYGRKTLNLLNSHEDPSFLHTVLYLEAARKFMPAPQANFVHVVINGESWGLYANAEQFNKEFIAEHFGATSGSRWKVNGSPMGRGGLEYLGDNVADYKRIYSIKSKDNDESWKALVDLCRILNETPTEELADKIEKVLDVDGALKFLALEVALINSDGYWTRASDYALYRDKEGVFHVIIHDANETFGPPAGPAMMGMNGGAPRAMLQNALLGMVGGKPKVSGVQLDPLVGLSDTGKPLRSKLLAVPTYKARYLELMKQINQEVLDWDSLKERIDHHVRLIDPFVKMDTRKLSSYEDFRKAVSTEAQADASEEDHAPKASVGPGRVEMSLQEFARQRHAFLESQLNP